MATDESLKRLGGGRWESRDGRFAIEPQSGTWVIVDNTQTDELGLPLVRGPFGSLTAAREAIETARASGPTESPFAERIKEAAKDGQARQPSKGDKATARKATTATAGKSAKAVRAAKPEAPPEPPPEPKWLRDLGPADRRRARDLIERLEKLDIAGSAEIARAEIARDQPALTRLALERSLGNAIASAARPADAVRAAVKVILSGKDSELGARWRLVDERGRLIDDLDVSD